MTIVVHTILLTITQSIPNTTTSTLLFLVLNYSLIRTFETASRKYSRSKMLK